MNVKSTITQQEESVYFTKWLKRIYGSKINTFRSKRNKFNWLRFITLALSVLFFITCITVTLVTRNNTFAFLILFAIPLSLVSIIFDYKRQSLKIGLESFVLSREYLPVQIVEIDGKSYTVNPYRDNQTELILNGIDSLGSLDDMIEESRKSEFNLPVVQKPVNELVIDNHCFIDQETAIISSIQTLVNNLFKTVNFEIKIPAEKLSESIIKILESSSHEIFSCQHIEDQLSSEFSLMNKQVNKLNGFIRNNINPSAETYKSVRRYVDDQLNYLNDMIERKEEAMNFITDTFFDFTNSYILSFFNFYCPDCASQDVMSEVKLNIETKKWHCDNCDNTYETDQLLKINRLKDNILYKAADNLWVEKEDEKNEIEREYQRDKKDMQVRFEDRYSNLKNAYIQEINNEKRLLRELKSKQIEYKSIYTGLSGTFNKYKKLNASVLSNYNNEMENLLKRTKEEARKSKDLLDKQLKKAQKQAIKNFIRENRKIKLEDIKRHRELLEIQKANSKYIQSQIEQEKSALFKDKADKSIFVGKLINTIRSKNYKKRANRSRDVSENMLKGF